MNSYKISCLKLLSYIDSFKNILSTSFRLENEEIESPLKLNNNYTNLVNVTFVFSQFPTDIAKIPRNSCVPLSHPRKETAKIDRVVSTVLNNLRS